MSTSTTTATTFEPGSSFGEYTIVRRIGRGGQGSVYEVQDGLGLTWALKVSDEMALNDPQAELRFAREARCVAENLSEIPRNVGILIGEHYGVWARRFYIKMKLLQGESLAQRLRRVGQLSIYEATKIFERVAFAVGHAHQHGVLHRDLKPENIFITTREEVVVLDWGCLQLIEAGQARTTLNGVICTPGYAPIEQYLATSVVTLTPAADIYALGVMFYEALAGYHPFLNWSRAALNQVRPNAVAAAVSHSAPPEPGDVQTVVVPTSVLRRLKAELQEQTAEPSGPNVLTNGKTWKSRYAEQAHTRAPATDGTPQGAVTAWGRTHATFELPAEAPVAKPQLRASAPSTRTIRPEAIVNASPAGVEEALKSRHVRAAKRGVPRRFSLVQVLALQERTLPQTIAGVPRELQQLLMRTLSKRATQRPQDALELSQQLRALLEAELKENRETFAESAPEQHSKYLARALWWTQLRQASSRFGYAAAGVLLSGLTGVGSYYGMSLTHAESKLEGAVAGSESPATREVTPPQQLALPVVEPPVVEAAASREEPAVATPAIQELDLAGIQRPRKAPQKKTQALPEPELLALEPVLAASATILPTIEAVAEPLADAPLLQTSRLRGSPRARLPGANNRARASKPKATAALQVKP